MSGVALSGAEASLAIVYFASDGVHFVTPVTVGFNNVVIDVRKVERETCSSLDNNITRSIVRDLETPGDGIVLWEDAVRKHGADIGHVVVKLNLESSHICIIPVGCGKSRDGWLSGDDLVALVEKCRYCIAIGVLNVDCGQANVAATNIWKLSPVVCLVVVPAPSQDEGRWDEIRDWSSEMVGDQVAICCVDMEQIGDVIACQREVTTVRSNCWDMLAIGPWNMV